MVGAVCARLEDGKKPLIPTGEEEKKVEPVAAKKKGKDAKAKEVHHKHPSHTTVLSLSLSLSLRL
jgi:hypothetical protein